MVHALNELSMDDITRSKQQHLLFITWLRAQVAMSRQDWLCAVHSIYAYSASVRHHMQNPHARLSNPAISQRSAPGSARPFTEHGAFVAT